MSRLKRSSLAAGLVLALLTATPAFAAETLLNVSYDPTRELYKAFNAAFAAHWKAKTGEDVDDRAVAWRLGQAGALGDRRAGSRCRDAGARLRHRCDRRRPARSAPNWQTRLPDNSSPYTSTIVFLVRKGNPEGHQGLGRSAQARRSGDHAQSEDLRRRALEFSRRLGLGATSSPAATTPRPRTLSRKLYKHVPVLDTGARGSTTTFVQRGIGDVLSPGKTRPISRSTSSAPTSSRSSCRRSRSSPSRRSRVVDAMSTQRHARGGRGLSRVSLHAAGAGDRGEELLSSRAIRTCGGART